MENQYDHNTMTKMISDIIKVDLLSKKSTFMISDIIFVIVL